MFGLALLSFPWFTIMSRAHGGGKPNLPWGLDAILLPLPYFLLWPYIGSWTILGYIFAIIGLRLGHGRGFNYNLPFKPGSSPERVEILIPKFLPVYWQKFMIMALSGLAVTLILAILMLFHGYVLSCLILALSGVLKSVAYMTRKTEASEYLRGALLGLGLWVAYLCTNPTI